MNLGHSIRSGVKWLMVGKLGNRLIEFLFGVILARLLVPADFGMIATIMVFTGFVGMFTSGGMSQSLIRAKVADLNDFTAVFTLQLALGVLVYLGFFCAAPWMARLFEQPLYSDLVRVSALTFLLRPFLTIRNTWLNREMNFKSRSMVDVMGGALTGLASVLMAWMGMGVWSLTISGILGALFQNFWLARLTPLKLYLNLDLPTMRKHSAYGFKIVATDFVSYLRSESKSLILSKLAGPSFLGLFKKAESLSRLPNQLMMSATMDPVFRAMSKSQDDLDKTKYLFYRTITLLMVYTTPIYVLLWWIGEPFISIVYGEKWLQAAAPMRILITAGIFLNIIHPCGVLMAAQNRVGQEILAQSLNLLIILAACYFGLQWGLEGVAWGIVLSHALLVSHFYWIVHQILPTRIVELIRAVAPGLFLSTLLFIVLKLIDAGLREIDTDTPLFYLLIMSFCGILFYLTAFLLIPIPAIKTEASRFREKIENILSKVRPQKSISEPVVPLINSNPQGPILGPIDNCQLHQLSSPKKGIMLTIKVITAPILILLLLIGSAGLLYSARDDIKPHITRLMNFEKNWFVADPPPLKEIHHIFDVGIVDANEDGWLDVYTSNHNYRQVLLLADAQGGYRDVLSEWGLDQNRHFPGWEQSFTAPVMDKPGLYIYWLGETLALRAQGLGNLGGVAGTLKMFTPVKVEQNNGFVLVQKEVKTPDSSIPQSVIEFKLLGGEGQLNISPNSRGVPTNIEIEPSLSLSKIFIGNQKITPTKHVFSPFLRDRHGLAWADYNADGQMDIYISRGGVGGMIRELPMTLRQSLNDELLISDSGNPPHFNELVMEKGISKKDCSGRHVKWLDFNLDGRLDLFVNCQDRGKSQGIFPKQLWRQESGGLFQDVAIEVGLGLPDHEFIDFIWMDADIDGDIDLLTTEDKGFFLYRNEKGRFTPEFLFKSNFVRADVAGLKGEVNNYWRFDGKLIVADYDADGDLDVFSTSKKGNVLLISDRGRLVLTSPVSMGLPPNSVSATWVDYDNDGLTDLYTVPDGLFRQEKNHHFKSTGLLISPPNKFHAAIAHWYDRDNNGTRDLLLALNENYSLWRWWQKPFKTWDDRFVWSFYSYRNLSSNNHWLNINVTGSAGNRQAIGARVTVTTDDGTQLQEVGGNDNSYFSQGHYRLYFGLGSHVRANKITVNWSDGQVKTLKNVAADQLLRIDPQP